MAHVWGRRDEENWMVEPYGPGQQAKDKEFVDAGSKLLDTLLAEVGGSAEDGYAG